MASAYFILGVLLIILGFCDVFVEARDRKQNKKGYYEFRETLSNLSVYNLNIFKWLLVIPVFIFYNYLFSVSKAWHFSWPKSEAINWLIAFVLADFIFYWYHAFSHRWNLLWAAHLVHHQPAYFNLSIAGRDGVLGKPVLCLMGLPFALTGLSPVTYFSAAFAGVVYSGAMHTRVIGRLGIIEYFLYTPHHHKIHHYKDLSRLGGTKNLGGVFTIWDRIFGTFWEEKKEEEGDYEFGINGVPAIYSPLKCQTFFYRHLFKLFFRVPFKDRLKLLFSYYLPEPIPPDASEFLGPSPSFNYYDWFFCFLLLVLTYQSTSVLTLEIALRLAKGSMVLDAALFTRLIVASGATLLGIFQIAKILYGAEGASTRVRRAGLLLTLAAVSLAFVFLSQQAAAEHKQNVINFALESRVLLAFGALIALRYSQAPRSAEVPS